MMTFDRAVEGVLKRDRLVVVGGLIVVTGLAWIYLIVMTLQIDMDGVMAGSTDSMSDMMKLERWTSFDALLMFIMWAVMMVGMMVPSATPMILLYALILRKQTKGDEALVPTSTFFAGYLTVWTSFSVGATALQWVLEQLALLSPMMVSTSPLLGGLVLILAAIYQWTPYKDACLKYCRSPVWFLSTHWRDGTWGAYLMGLEHGMYCLGCCWVLMAILFIGGVMNLLCVAAITIFVLVEKVAPFGRAISRAATVILLLSGGAMIIGV